MAYVAKLTPLGAAAIAAAVGGSPVELVSMAVGDASGVPYVPTGDEGDLVHQVAEVDILDVQVDPSNDEQLLITAIIPVEVGGFTVREAAVRMDDGGLFAIANIPATEKPDPDDNAAVEMLVVLTIAFSGEADVVITINGSAAFATHGFVYAAQHFHAVKSATTVAPPGGPVAGDRYVVPVAATGAWAGQDNKVAIYLDDLDGWLFVAVPQGARAGVADTGLLLRRTAAGWGDSIDGLTEKTVLDGSEFVWGFDPDTGRYRKIKVETLARHVRRAMDGLSFFRGMM